MSAGRGPNREAQEPQHLTAEDIFFAIHRDNPREGPGSDASTRRAFDLVPRLGPDARILDIGCGPGAQTMCLAGLCEAQIHAVDLYPQYLGQLSARVAERNLGDRIFPRAGDMRSLDYPTEHFDLIWAEGSIYLMGFAKGLEAWRTFLKPHGSIAVTELTWLQEERPPEAAGFWRANYPGMNNIADNLALIKRCGYRLLGYFTLPESDWWSGYYSSISAKLDRVSRLHGESAAAREAIESEREEMRMFEKYADSYGYVFYVAGKA